MEPTLNEMKYGMRNSKMLLNEVYFWTDTIKGWRWLLKDDHYKHIIINCWLELVKRKKITVYAFVIMPNHLHLIWKMKEKNGKEMPYASFNKFTSHQFLNDLRQNHPDQLNYYKEEDRERNHRFWQRDPLAIHLNSKDKAKQKLEYIHLNPLQEKWNLVTRPEDYKWSSAKFYEAGVDEFGLLTDYRERY
jgi:putative transposase